MGLRVGPLFHSLYFWCVDRSCMDWNKKWSDERVDQTEKFWGSDWEMSYVDRIEKWKRETHRAWRGSAAWGRGSWAFGVREMVEPGVWIRAWRALVALSACERAQTEIIWSENENVNCFTALVPYFTVNTENIFSLTQFSGPTKQPILRKNISEISLKPKQT